jgi:SAM-dependent methyltransferase/uncharacterized protein YbaR (Trm112 family)
VQYRLLDVLHCPACQHDLDVEVFRTEVRSRHEVFDQRRCTTRCAYRESGQQGSDCDRCSLIEITEGLVYCACGKRYPIIQGVPRFLGDELQAELATRYPEYYSEHEHRLQRCSVNDSTSEAHNLTAQTIDSFGYEWTEFAEYDAQNFWELVHPTKPEYFRAKLGLDCGCGAGRHTQEAIAQGAEMVAADLSWAVDTAYKKNAFTAKAMIVQCDVFHLPFKPEQFDFVYSLGVLHHTTDPPKAFDCLVPMLKPGAAIMVWIYANTRTFLLSVLWLVRRITLRLPNRVLKWISFFAACIDYGCVIGPYKSLQQIPVLGGLLRRFAPARVKVYAKYNFSVSYTDWFDRLSYPCVNYYTGNQVRSWYEKNGLTDIKISPTGSFAWRGVGCRAA